MSSTLVSDVKTQMKIYTGVDTLIRGGHNHKPMNDHGRAMFSLRVHFMPMGAMTAHKELLVK